jgi:hypothetical protein
MMYPTRVPFEELSVFSDVDVKCPNLEQHPLFKGATPYQVKSLVKFWGWVEVGFAESANP